MQAKIEKLNIAKNFCKVEQELLEWKAKAKIGKPERQILDAIIRQTNGYGRVEARISVRLFAKMTDIDRRNIWTYLKMLLDKKIIFRRPGKKDKFGKRVYYYSINPKYRRYNHAKPSENYAKTDVNPMPFKAVKPMPIIDSNRKYNRNIQNIVDRCNNFKLHYADEKLSSNKNQKDNQKIKSCGSEEK